VLEELDVLVDVVLVELVLLELVVDVLVVVVTLVEVVVVTVVDVVEVVEVELVVPELRNSMAPTSGAVLFHGTWTLAPFDHAQGEPLNVIVVAVSETTCRTPHAPSIWMSKHPGFNASTECTP